MDAEAGGGLRKDGLRIALNSSLLNANAHGRSHGDHTAETRLSRRTGEQRAGQQEGLHTGLRMRQTQPPAHRDGGTSASHPTHKPRPLQYHPERGDSEQAHVACQLDATRPCTEQQRRRWAAGEVGAGGSRWEGGRTSCLGGCAALGGAGHPITGRLCRSIQAVHTHTRRHTDTAMRCV